MAKHLAIWMEGRKDKKVDILWSGMKMLNKNCGADWFASYGSILHIVARRMTNSVKAGKKKLINIARVLMEKEVRSPNF
jgi:hypothetical protein